MKKLILFAFLIISFVASAQTQQVVTPTFTMPLGVSTPDSVGMSAPGRTLQYLYPARVIRSKFAQGSANDTLSGKHFVGLGTKLDPIRLAIDTIRGPTEQTYSISVDASTGYLRQDTFQYLPITFRGSNTVQTGNYNFSVSSNGSLAGASYSQDVTGFTIKNQDANFTLNTWHNIGEVTVQSNLTELIGIYRPNTSQIQNYQNLIKLQNSSTNPLMSLSTQYTNNSFVTTGTEIDLTYNNSIKITDDQSSLGLYNAADYSANIKGKPYALVQTNMLNARADSIMSHLPPAYNVYNHSDSLTQNRTVFFSTHQMILGDTVNQKAVFEVSPNSTTVFQYVQTNAANSIIQTLPTSATIASTDSLNNFGQIQTATDFVDMRATNGDGSDFDLYLANNTSGSHPNQAIFTDNINHRGIEYAANNYTPTDSTLVTKHMVDGLISTAGGSYAPTSRTITINGTTQDLSANRTWSVGTLTSLTGDVSASGSGSVAATVNQINGITKSYYDPTSSIQTQFNTDALALAKPIKVNNGTAYYAYGDSFTNNNGATIASNGYAPLLSVYLNLTETNLSLSGSGIWNAIKTVNANEGTTTNVFSSVMVGFNDIRRGGSSSLTQAKITNGYTAIFAMHFLDSLTAAGTSTSRIVETGGSWSNSYNAASVGGKTTSGASSTASGQTIAYTFYNDNVVVGMIGADGTLYNYGSFSVSIDGVSKGSYNLNGQTDGISDGVNDNGRSPFVLIYSGLGQGTHTITLTTTSANAVPIDYFGHLRQPSYCTPLLIFEIPYMNATGYTISPANASAAICDATNAAILSTIASWPSGYPVYTANTNAYYNLTNGVYTDNIHPNDRGHRQIYNAGYAAISSLQRILIPQPLSTTSSPTFNAPSVTSLYITGLTANSIPYVQTGGLLSQTNSNFSFDPVNIRLGVGLGGSTLDATLRILSGTNAGLRIGYNNTSVNYIDGNTDHFRSGAGAAIIDLTTTGFVPTSDNVVALGGASNAFTTVYAHNMQINLVGILKGGNLGTNISVATAGTDYLVPSASLTSGSVLYANGSGQATQDNANFYYNATGHQLGLAMSSTANIANTLVLGSNSTGFKMYNVEGTNSEDFSFAWSSNVLQMTTEKAGTGTLRNMNINANSFTLQAQGVTKITVLNGSSLSGGVNFGTNVSGTGAGSIAGWTGTFSNNSGVAYGAAILPTINQSSTAATTALWISPLFTASGSGPQLLFDFGTNSGSAGSGTHTSLFNMDKTGHIFMPEANNSFSGQATLVSGTKAITITGVTSSSRAKLSFVSINGGTVTTTWQYAGVCTSNTLTITALTTSNTTNTSDTSIINYEIIN